MEGPNFDPVLGEEVRFKDTLQNRPGIFKIIGVHNANDKVPQSELLNVYGRYGLATVDLRPEGKGLDLPFMPWEFLEYVDETRNVRRTIEWLKTNPEDREFPSYIVDYEVSSGDDHAGNPAIFVRFFVDQDYFYEDSRPSTEKIDALNKFLYEVQQVLLGLGLDRWTYVRSAEARGALDVAS